MKWDMKKKHKKNNHHNWLIRMLIWRVLVPHDGPSKKGEVKEEKSYTSIANKIRVKFVHLLITLAKILVPRSINWNFKSYFDFEWFVCTPAQGNDAATVLKKRSRNSYDNCKVLYYLISIQYLNKIRESAFVCWVVLL